MADWIIELEWTDIFTLFDRAASMYIINSEGNSIHLVAFVTLGWFLIPCWAVLSLISTTEVWLVTAPPDLTAAVIVNFAHQSRTFWAFSWVVTTFFSKVNSLDKVRFGAVACLPEAHVTVGISFIPDFSSSISVTEAIDTSVAEFWVHAFSANSDKSWFTEATGFVVSNFSEMEDISVLTSPFFGWSACVVLFVLTALLWWAEGFRSPVVDADSSIARAFLGESGDDVTGWKRC